MGRPEKKRPLGKPRRRCKENINKDLEDIEMGGMDSNDLPENRNSWRPLVNAVMNLRLQ
jgi:hypothetical protein